MKIALPPASIKTQFPGRVFIAKETPEWAAAAQKWRDNRGRTIGPPEVIVNGILGWWFPMEAMK